MRSNPSHLLQQAAGVARAFQMAAQLPTRERVRLRVGVLSADDVMIAGGTLRGFEQAALLRDQLELVGFAEYVPAAGAPTYGCDLLLKEAPSPHRSGSRDLMRNAPRHLWPPRGKGAGPREDSALS